MLEGPTAFTFVLAEGGDVALAAKALATFRREHDVLAFKGGVMNGDPLTVDQLEALSKLPAREVLHQQLVGMIASPITGLVRGLNALISGLAIQLGQIRDQGLVGGDAPRGGAALRPEEAAAPRMRLPLRRPLVMTLRGLMPRVTGLRLMQLTRPPRATRRKGGPMATAAELIDEIKKMSVLELSELIKALEEEFGVSATAVAAAAPAAGAPVTVPLPRRSRRRSTSSSPVPVTRRSR